MPEPTKISLDATDFGFRPYETVRIHEKPPAFPAGITFGVKLIPVDLPGPRGGQFRDLPPYALIAAYYYKEEGGWGFLGMQQQAKDAIAEMMEGANCQMNVWYWVECQPSK